MDVVPPTRQEVQRRQRDDAERQHHEDVRALVATPGGRRLVWHLFGVSGLWGASFAGEATHATAYQEGRRSVARDVMELLHRVAAPSYALMVQEQMAALQRRELELEGAAPDDEG